MFCNKCGKEIKDGMLFCTNCGAKVSVPQEKPKVKEPMPTVQKSGVPKPQMLTIIIGVLVVVIVVLVCVMFLSKSGKKEDEASWGYEETIADLETEDQQEEVATLVEETEQEEPAAEPEPEEPASQYFLPESDSRYLTMEELEGFTAADCRLARNELYARHGRRFNDENLQAHFDSCEWYQGTIAPEDFDESVLNEYEIANRDLIVQYESVLEARGMKGTTTYTTYVPKVVTFEISNDILTVVTDDGSRFRWNDGRGGFSISYPIAEDCIWETGHFEYDFVAEDTTDYEYVKSYIENEQAGYEDSIEELRRGEAEINSPMGIHIEVTDGVVVKVYTSFS